MSHSSNRIELEIQGMHCAGCAQGIEKRLSSLGLKDVSVDFPSQRAIFTLENENSKTSLKLKSIYKEIKALGYRVSNDPDSATSFLNNISLEKKFVFCLIFTLPLLLHMFLPWHALHNPYIQLVLCLPVFLLGLFHFGISALGSIRARSPNMDVLILIGITSSFLYSLTGTLLEFGPDFLFYESSATITTIVLFGNLLEKAAAKKTHGAIEELGKIQASRAKRIIADDKVEEIDALTIQLGEKLIVNSGDIVPCDAKIYWGRASINESMLTGESFPVEKTIGDSVIGGTVLISGSIKVEASAVGETSVLASIIRLVKTAQAHKPPIQRLADKVSAIFTPIVVLIALLTFFIAYGVFTLSFGESLLRAVAVLVIACPCALGLATPAAIMVGIGQAAKHGILIKGGIALEAFSKIKKIIFDKTGTLTEGNFKIKKLEHFELDLDEIKAIIHGLELHSSHPIAKSILRELAHIPAFKFQEVEEIKGIGLNAKDSAGNSYQLGSPLALNHANDAQIVLLKNSKLIAAIYLEDSIKQNALRVLDWLRSKGISIVLLSGDREKEVAQVANALRITEYYAQRLPDQKLSIISKLQAEEMTAFVGDGVNDAPALTQAAVGISLSNATNAAIESAQIILLNGDLEYLQKAYEVTHRTLRIMKQNLFWAFLYNALAIPVAACGYLDPTLAALTMAFSDVFVIFNSLRLKLN